MLAMLAVSTVCAAFTASASEPKKLCKCEKFAMDNDIHNISVDNIDLAFCDPRLCSTNGTCCINTFNSIFCPSMLSLVITPERVLSNQSLSFSVNFNVPDGTTGIFQNFLPSGFTFVTGSFFVDGVLFTPTINNGIIELREITAGLHTITFTVTSSVTTVEFQTLNVARAFTVSNNIILNFGQASFLTTVLPVSADSSSSCNEDNNSVSNSCNVDNKSKDDCSMDGRCDPCTSCTC